MNFTDKLTEIAQEILAEQEQDRVLDAFAKLRAFVVEEEIVQRIVEDKPEAAELQRHQRFLFYTLESLVCDVWRQLNTDSLLFLGNNLFEENARIARAVAEAILSVVKYVEIPHADAGQEALERWTDAVDTLLTVLKDVNSSSIEEARTRAVHEKGTRPLSVPARGNFDPTAVRLAERALLTAFNPSAHILSSAGRSSYFFDFDRFILNRTSAPLVRKALESEIDKIQKRFGLDYLGIPEKRGENTIGCILTSDYLSSRSEIPVVLIRLARQLLVDRVKTAKDESIEGKKILPVTDNISNGNEIRSVVRALRNRGAVITDVLAVLFRGDDAVREELEQDDIVRIHALLTPEILHFTAQSLIPRVQDEDTREMLKATVKEIEKKHLAGVWA